MTDRPPKPEAPAKPQQGSPGSAETKLRKSKSKRGALPIVGQVLEKLGPFPSGD